MPTARWVEYLTPTPLIDDLVETPFQLDDEGCLAVPAEPGLGVRWNADAIEKHSGMRLTPSDV